MPVPGASHGGGRVPCRPWLRGALLTLLAGLFLAGCSVFGDPPQDPPAELTDFDSTLRIRKAWSASIGDGTEFLRLALVPATDGTRVFAAAYDGRIAAFAANQGKRLWRIKTKLPLSAGPATDGTTVVVGSSNGEIVALAADDGRQLWRQSVPSEVLAPPALAGGFALVRTVDGKLTAFRLTDGGQAWFVQQAVPRLSVRGTAAPAVAGTAVVCGFDNGRIAAFEISDGTQLWDVLLQPPAGRNEVERLVDVNTAIQVAGDDLYAAAYQGRVAALAQESGQILWSQEYSTYSGLAVDAGSVYVSGPDGTLTALSRSTGASLWSNDVLRNRDITGPAAFQSSVVVGDYDGYLHWFDASTGQLQARVRAGGDRITSAPVAANDLLFALTDGGKLVAYRPSPR